MASIENKELEIKDIEAALREPTDKRIFVISKAMHKGYTVDQIHELTKIDHWFLYKLKHIIDVDEQLKNCNINTLDKTLLRTAKNLRLHRLPNCTCSWIRRRSR